MAQGKALEPKQEAFVAAYLGSARLNATKAAILAGYSERGARTRGSLLLANANIQAAIQAWRDEVRASAIAQVEYRVDRLGDLEGRYWTVIQERADKYRDDEDAAGGGTGLIVKRWKMIGSGESATMVAEYEADVAVTKEIQSLYDQVAKELGQRTEKVQHDATGDFLAALRSFAGAT
ncbi:terminase small subunit [Iamia sp.]|uniref:terminase small subunit n=1 Tax=Iamia sp. TaxID=2722710 RepID=UPI002CFBFFD3|nr:terminase small subunit [Iamia sp.]HXH57924.1 terminase small subunit [Iamia sp.]